jgi:hypothetical protein
MAFKVTIEQTRDVVKTVGKEWKPMGQEQKEGAFDCKVYLSDIYGYTPEISKTVTVTEKVYEQIVDDLDLKAVINAVND